jgi:hypothetical protein
VADVPNEEVRLVRGEFPELVERTRRTHNDVCEKAKLVLRRLLPHVETLQKDNAHFSPRIMLVMLARVGDQLPPDEREGFRAALQYAEAFQLQLVEWMTAVQQHDAAAGGAGDARRCADALELITKHSSELDALLANVIDRDQPPAT